MKTMTLYTGGGVSLSPIPAEDRVVSSFVRLIADEGMGLTRDNGETVFCVDTNKPDEWQEREAPELWVADDRIETDEPVEEVAEWPQF